MQSQANISLPHKHLRSFEPPPEWAIRLTPAAPSICRSISLQSPHNEQTFVALSHRVSGLVQRERIDRDREASHDLIRLLNKPGLMR